MTQSPFCKICGSHHWGTKHVFKKEVKITASDRTKKWKGEHPEEYRKYMKEYMRKRRTGEKGMEELIKKELEGVRMSDNEK